MVPVACGTPAGSRQLVSVTVSPAAANPLAPTGKIQFTATGHYSASPMTETPQPAQWGACVGEAATAEVTVSSTGLAACTSGASGTYTVWAAVPTECTAITACGGGCTVSGTAQLTCP
jgi:hypothetical protein